MIQHLFFGGEHANKFQGGDVSWKKTLGKVFLDLFFLAFFLTDCTMGFITIKPPFGINVYIFKYMYIYCILFWELFSGINHANPSFCMMILMYLKKKQKQLVTTNL